MKNKPLLVIVEDESDIQKLLRLNLENKYQLKIFSSSENLFEYIEKNDVSLLLLDVMLPGKDGFEICKEIRNGSKVNLPIIILSAKADEIDKVLGLELGADDYITKPFSVRELKARIKAVLRRNQVVQDLSGKRIELGELIIYKDKMEVQLNKEKIIMTSVEFKILELLCSRPGWAFSREKILNTIWGYEKAVIDRTVDVHIRHLREKLGKFGDRIHNVRGVGYKFLEL